MEDKKFYIGKVEEICKISKKTLRFYDKIGLLSPDEISMKNSYRYYSKGNLYNIPIIKYYKQSGFKLENIKNIISISDFDFIEKKFDDKINELNDLEKELSLKKKSIEDWNSLLKEARMVIENNLCDVKIKHIEKKEMIFYNQDYNYDYESSIINIEFTNYVEQIHNSITGPVIIEFPSFEEKLQRKTKKIKVIQKYLLKANEEEVINFGDCMAISCYHIGSHSTIEKTYEKMKKWIKDHNYKCESKCYERYVVDYWTTKEEKNFVTEVIINLSK